MNPLAGMPAVDLTPEILSRIVEIGMLRLPNEACGVLLPTPRTPHSNQASQVIEIPNRSLFPADQYEMNISDVDLETRSWFEANLDMDPHRIAFWHTHPKGGIGPSRGDLKIRLEKFPYLVVAFTESGPVPAWF